MLREGVVEVVDEGRGDGVVGVDEGDEIAGGELEAKVPRGGDAGVGLAEVDDAGVSLGVGLGDFGGAVGRAVVYEDDLEVFVSLGEDAIEGGGEIGDYVVDGDYDGDFGGGWGLTFWHKCDKMGLFPEKG